MVEELGIDPEGIDIGWYPDSETPNHYIMRFELDGEEYNLGYNKEEEQVERLD
jgi:hypothetical protein